MKALAVVTVVFLPPSLIAVRVAHDPACNFFRNEILYHELTSTSADDIQYVNVRLAGLGITSDDSQLLDLLGRLHTTGNPLDGPGGSCGGNGRRMSMTSIISLRYSPARL